MPFTPRASLLTGYCLLFSGMALVGVYTALSKPLSGAFPVFLLAWLRFAIAALVMLPWLRRADDEPPHSTATRHALFLQSLFGNFLFSILMLSGVAITSAAAAGVIMAALPPLVAVFSWWFLREHAGARVWVATALAAAGIALLSTSRGDPSTPSSIPGNLLVLGAAACEAIYVILGKRLTATLSPRRISALINLIGLLLMTPLGLWQASQFDFTQVGAPTWALLVFYSLSASIISTWLWLSGLKHVPAAHSGVFTVALPLAATATAATVLGESIGVTHFAALACALAGIALVAGPVSKRNGASSQEPRP